MNKTEQSILNRRINELKDNMKMFQRKMKKAKTEDFAEEVMFYKHAVAVVWARLDELQSLQRELNSIELPL